MSKIIHWQTVVNTVFAEIDDDGNVVRRVPLQVEVPKLDPELFVQAHAKLAQAKVELVRENEKRADHA